jgi:hypothetical protein
MEKINFSVIMAKPGSESGSRSRSRSGSRSRSRSISRSRTSLGKRLHLTQCGFSTSDNRELCGSVQIRDPEAESPLADPDHYNSFQDNGMSHSCLGRTIVRTVRRVAMTRATRYAKCVGVKA